MVMCPGQLLLQLTLIHSQSKATVFLPQQDRLELRLFLVFLAKERRNTIMD